MHDEAINAIDQLREAMGARDALDRLVGRLVLDYPTVARDVARSVAASYDVWCLECGVSTRCMNCRQLTLL